MIGERLLDLRKDAGITQETLAKELSVTKHTISSYEKEKSCPSDKTKISIAKYFNVSIDYLLGLVDEPIPYKADSTIIRLPVKLQKQAKKELKEFIDYLLHKYMK